MINDAARSVGPNPAAHARTSVWRVTTSNWRMLDQVNARSHVPIVDGARTWSNSTGAAPARSTSTSSMLSPPASIAPSTVTAFAPQDPDLGPLASFTRASTRPAMPSRCTNNAGTTNPALGTKRSSSKVTDTPARLCDAFIRQMPSGSDLRRPQQSSLSQARGHLPLKRPRRHAPTRWIQA